MTKLQKAVIKQAFLDVEKMEHRFFDTYPKPNPAIEKESWIETKQIVDDYAVKHQKRTISVKRRIMIGLITALLIVSTMFSVSAVREAIIEFFVEVFDDFIHLFANEDIDSSDERHYSPAWLPDGYEENEKVIQDLFEFYAWDKGENIITFFQYSDNVMDAYLDNEDTKYMTQNISVYKVHYTLKNGVYMCIWANDEYTFMLKCPESVGWDNVVKIISSVQEVTPQTPTE